MSEEKEISQLIPGYALNCLDEEEAGLVAGNLKESEALQTELQNYTKIVDQLALAGNYSAPSAALKQRLMDRVQLSPQKEKKLSAISEEIPSEALTPAAVPPPSVPWWQSIWDQYTRISPALAGAALVLLLALVGSQWFLQQQISTLESQVVSQKKMIVNLVNTQNAPGASGYIIFVDKEGKNILFVRGLDLLDQSKQYQLWMVQEGNRTSEAVFSVHPDGSFSTPILSSLPLSEKLRFGISIEPQGGSPGPTGLKVLGTPP